MSTADLLLHPVRLSILQGLLGDEPVTTKVLAQRLPGIRPPRCTATWPPWSRPV